MKDSAALTLSNRATRGDSTRQRIVDAAIREFKSSGFDRTSIGAIARAAGVSRPTFYFHFAGKEQLLFELQHHLEEPIVVLIEDSASFTGALSATVRGLVRARRSVGSRQLFSDMLLIYTKQTAMVALADQPLLNALLQKFQAAQEAAELRPKTEPMRASLLYLSSLYGYLIGQGRLESDEECIRGMQVISDLFVDQ